MCVLNMYFWNKPIPRTDFSFIITLQSAHKCVFYIGNIRFSESNQFLEQTFRSLLPSSRLTKVCFTQEICVFLKQKKFSNWLVVHYYPPVGSHMCVLHMKYMYLWNKPIPRTDFSFIITIQSAHKCVLHCKYVYFWNKQIPRTDFSFIITIQSAHKCAFYNEHMCISETNEFLERTFRLLLPSSRLTTVCVYIGYMYFWNKQIPRTEISFIITHQSAHKCVCVYKGNMVISETNQFLKQTFRSLLPSSRLTTVCFTQEIYVFLKQTNSSNRLFVHYYLHSAHKCVFYIGYMCISETNNFLEQTCRSLFPSSRLTNVFYIGNAYFWNKLIPRTVFSFIITLQSAHKCVFYNGNMCISETN